MHTRAILHIHILLPWHLHSPHPRLRVCPGEALSIQKLLMLRLTALEAPRAA